MHFWISFLLVLSLVGHASAETRLNSSVLPGGRSVQIGDSATAFLSVVNGVSGDEATGCTLELSDPTAGAFSYRATGDGNIAVGEEAPIFAVGPGTVQSFVFGITPENEFDSSELFVDVVCENGTARRVFGVNSFILSASASPTADIIPIALSPSGDGVMRVAEESRVGVISMAAINIGASGNILVRPEYGPLPLPYELEICETNASGVCTSARSRELALEMGAEPRTFNVYVRSMYVAPYVAGPDDDMYWGREGVESLPGSAPFWPDIVRVNVEFSDLAHSNRGVTSVAVAGPAPPFDAGPGVPGYPEYNLNERVYGIWSVMYAPYDPEIPPVSGRLACSPYWTGQPNFSDLSYCELFFEPNNHPAYNRFSFTGVMFHHEWTIGREFRRNIYSLSGRTDEKNTRLTDFLGVGWDYIHEYLIEGEFVETAYLPAGRLRGVMHPSSYIRIEGYFNQPLRIAKDAIGHYDIYTYSQAPQHVGELTVSSDGYTDQLDYDGTIPFPANPGDPQGGECTIRMRDVGLPGSGLYWMKNHLRTLGGIGFCTPPVGLETSDNSTGWGVLRSFNFRYPMILNGEYRDDTRIFYALLENNEQRRFIYILAPSNSE